MNIKSTIRSIALTAAPLLIGASQAVAQLPISQRLDLQIRTTAVENSVTMYEVWATGSKAVSTSGGSATQEFLATAPKLTSVVANLSTPGSVTVSVSSGSQVLGSAVAVKNSSQATATFTPPLAIMPGEVYSVRIVCGSPATFIWSKDEDAYLWDCGAAGKDLNLRIIGAVPSLTSMPSGRPQQRALLVLLENGGIAQSTVPILNKLCPRVTISTCGSLEFELKKDEHTTDLITRIIDKIGSNLQCLDPMNWKQRTIRLDGWVEGVTDYIIEEIAKAVSTATINTSAYRYDKVELMEDAQFTAPRVLAKLKQLAPDYEIDVHVLAHGGEDVIIGHDQKRLDQSNFFREIAAHNARSSKPIRLRAVYQMNCVSGTLIREWLECGAVVVNGTRDKLLNCMPTQYFGFLNHWLKGEQFDEAVRSGYEEAKPYMSMIFSGEPELIEDSRMVIHGSRNLRITN